MSEKTFDQKAYNKEYYEKHKEKWASFYKPKLCEFCNKNVLSLNAHNKTKLHKQNVELYNYKNQNLNTKNT